MPKVNYELRQSFFQVCRNSFWYKKDLIELLKVSDVPNALIKSCDNENKYNIGVKLLEKLETQGDTGWFCIRKIFTEINKLRDIKHEVENRDKALNSLKEFKILLKKSDLNLNENTTKDTNLRFNPINQNSKCFNIELDKLYEKLKKMIKMDNAQKRGYDFEKLIFNLIKLNDIKCSSSYRLSNSEQIDGSLSYNGFDYLIEVKWTENKSDKNDLACFCNKINDKLDSTRGLFISYKGFNENLIEKLTKTNRNIILMCGWDLTLILDNRISLKKALDLKIQKAFKEGIFYYKIKDAI